MSFKPLGQISGALFTHSRGMQIISENMAQLNVVGAKQKRPEFRSFITESSGHRVVPQVPLTRPNGVYAVTRQDILRQGLVTPTNRQFDLSLNGNGFFLVRNRYADPQAQLSGWLGLTRNGQVDLQVERENGQDRTYFTIGPDKDYLLGWIANSEGEVTTSQDPNSLRQIVLEDLQTIIEPIHTTEIVTRFNLSADLKPPATTDLEFNFYDAKGNGNAFNINFTRTPGTNTWLARYSSPEGYSGSGEFEMQFDYLGRLIEPADGKITLDFVDSEGVARPILLDMSRSTSFGSTISYLLSITNDGHPGGEIQDMIFDKYGNLLGLFPQGGERILARIAVGDVPAREQLNPVTGGAKWRLGRDTGQLQLLDMATATRVDLTPASVERSNMDLAELFSEMIITQKVYGVLSKALTTVDEMASTSIEMRA